MTTHREMYPEQYAHPLVGKLAVVEIDGETKTRGTVERVVASRFGPLVIFEGRDREAWSLRSVREVVEPD